MPKKLTYQDHFDKGCDLLSTRMEVLAKELVEHLTFATGFLKFEEKDYSSMVELLVLLEKALKDDNE